jgi:alanine dehydrogenase
MIVGVPREIKSDEYRVAMTPNGVEELSRAGHRVLIESGAGVGSGITDETYTANGAEIVPSTADVWKRADLIVKVKEPLTNEWPHMRPGQTIFTYFHFAADEELTRAVMKSGVTAIAYETIKPTTHENPTYVIDGVIHYGVANMPGAVPRTSTLALTNATLPYAMQLANKGWKQAVRDNAALRKGLNMIDGKVVYPAVADAFGLESADVEKAIA